MTNKQEFDFYLNAHLESVDKIEAALNKIGVKMDTLRGYTRRYNDESKELTHTIDFIDQLGRKSRAVFKDTADGLVMIGEVAKSTNVELEKMNKLIDATREGYIKSKMPVGGYAGDAELEKRRNFQSELFKKEFELAEKIDRLKRRNASIKHGTLEERKTTVSPVDVIRGAQVGQATEDISGRQLTNFIINTQIAKKEIDEFNAKLEKVKSTARSINFGKRTLVGSDLDAKIQDLKSVNQGFGATLISPKDTDMERKLKEILDTAERIERLRNGINRGRPPAEFQTDQDIFTNKMDRLRRRGIHDSNIIFNRPGSGLSERILDQDASRRDRGLGPLAPGGRDRDIEALRQYNSDHIRKVAEAYGVLKRDGMDAAKGLSGAWGGYAKFWASGFLAKSINDFKNALVGASKEARELDKQVALIRTLSEGKPSQSVEFSNILGLSNKTGFDAKDVAAAKFEALSQQIPDTQANKFIETAAVLARATGSSLEETEKLLATTLNAYGMDISKVTELSDMFFKTIDLGNVSMKELSQNFGRATPVAKTLGVSVAELLTAIDVVSKSGVPTATAITQVTNAMLKAIDPSEKTKELYRKMGVETGAQAVAMKGFLPLFKEFIEMSQNLPETGREFFPDIRGFQAFAAIKNNLEGSAKDFEAISKHSKDSAKNAADLVNAVDGQKLTNSLNRLENAWTRIGQKINKALNAAMEFAEQGADSYEKNFQRPEGFNKEELERQQGDSGVGPRNRRFDKFMRDNAQEADDRLTKFKASMGLGILTNQRIKNMSNIKSFNGEFEEFVDGVQVKMNRLFAFMKNAAKGLIDLDAIMAKSSFAMKSKIAGVNINYLNAKGRTNFIDYAAMKGADPFFPVGAGPEEQAKVLRERMLAIQGAEVNRLRKEGESAFQSNDFESGKARFAEARTIVKTVLEQAFQDMLSGKVDVNEVLKAEGILSNLDAQERKLLTTGGKTPEQIDLLKKNFDEMLKFKVFNDKGEFAFGSRKDAEDKFAKLFGDATKGATPDILKEAQAFKDMVFRGFDLAQLDQRLLEQIQILTEIKNNTALAVGKNLETLTKVILGSPGSPPAVIQTPGEVKAKSQLVGFNGQSGPAPGSGQITGPDGRVLTPNDIPGTVKSMPSNKVNSDNLSVIINDVNLNLPNVKDPNSFNMGADDIRRMVRRGILNGASK
jgi:TP901 family phage tail tape measure protein